MAQIPLNVDMKQLSTTLLLTVLKRCGFVAYRVKIKLETYKNR